MENLAPVLEAVPRRGGIQLHPADWIDFRHANGARMRVVGRAVVHDKIWHHYNQHHIGPLRQSRILPRQVLLPVASRVVSRRRPPSGSLVMTILGWVVSEPTAAGGVRYSPLPREGMMEGERKKNCGNWPLGIENSPNGPKIRRFWMAGGVSPSSSTRRRTTLSGGAARRHRAVLKRLPQRTHVMPSWNARSVQRFAR